MELTRAQSQRQAAARRLTSALEPLQQQLVGAEGLQLRLAGSEADQLRQTAELERAMESAERAGRHELERLKSTLLQQVGGDAGAESLAATGSAVG